MTLSPVAYRVAAGLAFLGGSAGTLAAQSGAPGLAGTYQTDVALLENSCREAPVRPMPTVVKHRTGDSTIALEHAGLEYLGVIRADRSIAMQPRSIEAGNVTYTLTVNGAFASHERFDARVRIDVRGPGPTRCSYLVGWTGHRPTGTEGAATPSLPRDAIMRFRWTSAGGVESPSGDAAPHGFVVRVDDSAEPVALTAHHVVERYRGENGAAVARGVRHAQLVPAGSGAAPVVLGSMLPLTSARTIDGESWDRDVAMFSVPRSSTAPALTLAPDQAVEGDTVWLLAAVRGSSERLHPAVVIISRDSAFAYRYVRLSDGSLTSGAAVLDRSGRVTGLNVGTVPVTPERWARFESRFPGCCEEVPADGVVGIAVGARALRRHLLPVASRH